MIHRPSRVACKPFGAGPGELNTVSTLPTLRVRIRAGSKREAAIAVAAVAAVNVSNSLRFMAAPLQAILYQAAPLHCMFAIETAIRDSVCTISRQPLRPR